ncbi:MAG TPA: hypothetical protein VM580_05560, partial [Labilithrix sp.]|nr:hypothetical protein [Labilithrix sp.]
ILDSSRDDRTTRAAAEGLARIGTDEALSILTTEATKARGAQRESSARELAILSGMHDARRETAARFLESRLRDADHATARIIVKSLGGVGNAWAWKTISDQTEASATRRIAAKALVEAYVKFTGDVRAQAAKAILVVDDASTPSLIAEAKKGASHDVAGALDTLEVRFAKNPAR